MSDLTTVSRNSSATHAAHMRAKAVVDGRSECIGSGQEYTDPRGAFRTVERSALEVGSPVSFNVMIYKGAPCFE